MAGERAPVTPDVLRWARESVGVSVDEAARRADVTAERILTWESGGEEPTLAKLRSLATLYQRPLSVFFLPEAPTGFDVIRDFRRLPRSARTLEWSRALHKVYRRATSQREVVEELLASEDVPFQSDMPESSTGVDPEVAGRELREHLGIGLSTQFSWRRPEDALAGWIDAVEARSVLVLRTSEVALSEMRGFSLSEGEPAVIVVNALDSPRGQVFSLLHECAHLMLQETGICNLLEPSNGRRAVEQWCNATAAAALMPAEELLASLDGATETREWDDEALAQLSGRWSVSREAVLRRLVSLNRTSYKFYLSKRRQYLREYERWREDERERRKGRAGGPPPYRMAIRDRGRPYVRMVLDAYHRDAITSSSASNLLNLKLKHLSELEAEVGG